MRKTIIKRVIATVVTLAVGFGGFLYAPKKVQAEETGAVYQEASGVVYQETSNTTFLECINAQKAPDYVKTEETDNSGYLFAGWYTMVLQDDNSYKPGTVITEAGSISEAVFAKYVPAHLAGIACQVNVNPSDDAKRNLRIVSVVDSQNYSAVGFNIYGRYDADGDGKNETEWLMYKYSSDGSNKAQSTKVYDGLYVYASADATPVLKYPSDVFGSKAEGFYFTTVSISGITESFFDATMAVKPYWVTMDGTYVEGMGEFNRVNDSYIMNQEENIINVSVNLKDASSIAAGMLNITCPEGFALKEVECGRVFEEMEYYASGNTIKCVGNVKELINADNPNEVYVNLRFTKTSSNDFAVGEAEFVVDIPQNGFCDITETIAEVSAWNVIY